MSITVVIPCYKRAEYLITALQTVRSQTAIKFVDKIIVSENSRSLESKKVCEQFPDLPIEYHQQEKDLTAVEHLSRIINQSTPPLLLLFILISYVVLFLFLLIRSTLL